MAEPKAVGETPFYVLSQKPVETVRSIVCRRAFFPAYSYELFGGITGRAGQPGGAFAARVSGVYKMNAALRIIFFRPHHHRVTADTVEPLRA